MSKRTVFGRRWFAVNGEDIKVELREQGVFVRYRGRRKVWFLSAEHLLHLCKTQLTFQYEELGPCDEGKSMPGVPEGFVVLDKQRSGPVHEGGIQQTPPTQVGGDGLAALIGKADAEAARKGLPHAPDTSGLPRADDQMASGNQTPPIP